ncbi:MAG: hypothetical protein R2867_32000 [Caldilineaceae bacterium]
MPCRQAQPPNGENGGIAYDPTANRLYLAMSAVDQGMTDGKGDIDVAVEQMV